MSNKVIEYIYAININTPMSLPLILLLNDFTCFFTTNWILNHSSAVT